MAKDEINYAEHTGAKGGPVLGRTRDFTKEADAFRTDTGPGARQDYEKGSTEFGGESKTLKPVKSQG